MTTQKQKKAATVSAIAIAAFDAGRAEGNVIDVIKAAIAAGASKAEVAVEFRAGRIADLIFKRAGKPKVTEAERNAAIKRGLAIVAACEPGRTPKAGQAVRTEEDQALFEPTKRWWSRTGRDAGVIEPRKSSPRNEEKQPPKPPKGEPKPITLPKKPKSPKVAFDAVRNLSHLLAAFCKQQHKLLPVEVIAKCNGLAVELDKLAKAE